MISGILLFLILPLAMAGIVYVLLRWLPTVAALLSVATALVLGIAIIRLPLDRPFTLFGGREIEMGEEITFLGRELVLGPSDRMAMALMFLAAAVIFFLAWRFASRSLLFPIGLSLLSLWSGALLIQPFLYGALLIEVGAALSVFALQREGGPPSRGGIRYLTFTTLALPGLLLAQWVLDRYAITPDDVELLRIASILLGFSFALLLGAVPFHTWVTAVAGDGVSLSGAFVLTVGQGAIWFTILDFLERYPWLSGHPQLDTITSSIGLAMIILGGILAPAQRRLGSFLGYVTLVDFGASLTALALRDEQGLALIFLSLLVRPIGVGLMAASIEGLRGCKGGDASYEELEGLGWKAPWSTLALVFGAFSIAGMPVSAGFIWRWALYRDLIEPSPGIVVFLLLSSLGGMVALWRVLSPLLRRPPVSSDEETEEAFPVVLQSEGWLTAIVVSVVVLGCIAIGLFPQMLSPVVVELTEAYTFFSP